MSEVYAVSRFKAQEQEIDERCKKLDTQLDAVENIIKHAEFMSRSLDLYNAFMYGVALAWSLAVTTGALVGVLSVSATGHPIVEDGQTAQTAEPTKQSSMGVLPWIGVIVLAALGFLAFYFDNILAATNRAVQPVNATTTAMSSTTTTTSGLQFLMFVLALFALALVAPKILDLLSSLKERKEKQPETLTSWLAKRLGWETWKNGKFWDGGIMFLYYRAFIASPHSEVALEVQEQFSDPNNPAITEGLRSHWRTEARGKFRARIAEVRTLIEEAKGLRIAELNRYTVDVSKAPAVAPRGAR